MLRLLLPPVAAALTTLFVALPMAAGGASAPDPPAPRHLVMDSESAPVLSVDQTALAVEIVLVPDAEYHPVHPDSLDEPDASPSAALPDAGGEQGTAP